uniref:E3 ubiquitin-protein ligase Topors n=1 Tax=Gasterosteus aculeatus aculeatus TaxID=481459 RepID=A0AAQ4QFM4_GASAC
IMSAIKVALQQSQKKGKRKPSEEMSADVSPDSKCPICLDQFNNISYLDVCLHKFCFRCIHEWSKNKAECPLCKQSFNSIYHSINSEQDFKKYDLQPVENASFGTFGGVRFRYRTTLTGIRSVRDGGRSRDTSAEFFQRNPACLHRLIPWLKRELVVLYGAHGSLVNIVQHIIMSRITHSSASSSVIAISEDEEYSAESNPPGDPASSLSHSLWDDETPGPSYSTTAEQETRGPFENEESPPYDSDDCVIISVVKPTADRTPELVQLSSDSDESASEDIKAVPLLPQHIRFSSLSPVASQSSDPSGAGQSENVETDLYHKLDSQTRCSSLTSSRHKRSGKSDRKERSREDKDRRRKRRSRSAERAHSSRSPVISHSSVSKLSRERSHSYSSGRNDSKCGADYSRRYSVNTHHSYRRYSPERSDSGMHYTETRSYYYSSREYPDRRPRSRSRSRDRRNRDTRPSPSRTYSSSRSPSTKRRSHNKPGGKRKYKTRHLEETSKNTNSNADGNAPILSTKHKKKSRKRSKDRSMKTSRSLSVELVNDENGHERSKRHHKKKKKHKKKSKRHKSSERTGQHSPSVITIESDGDYSADDNGNQACSTEKDDPVHSTTEDPVGPAPPHSMD